MHRLLPPLIFIQLVLTGCGSSASQVTPLPTSAVPHVSSTPVPTSTPLLPTPVPTVALPTVTPVPTPDPDQLFHNWLTEQGYEFFGDVNDGSKRYRNIAEDETFYIDIRSDSVLAWDSAFTSDQLAIALYKTTEIIVAAIETHGFDARPVRAALQSPYDLPLSLQISGYSFLLEISQYGDVTARVIFINAE